MNTNFFGRDRASFDCSEQWSYEARLPAYLESEQQPNVFFDDTGYHPDSCSSGQCYEDLYADEPDDLHDDFSDLPKEELYDMEELILLEQAIFQQRELYKMRLAHELKKEMYATDDYTFLEKLIWKQQRLRQFLDEDNGRWASREINQLKKSDGFINAQSSMVEKEALLNQSYPMEQFSEQGSSMKSSTQSDSGKTSQPQEPRPKSRHCRHFLKGHCERGESCGFRHDRSVFCTDMQKVFLGGLPPHLTSSLLRKKLTEQGFTVLNNPKILRWFSPQVCLGSVEEAQQLVQKGTIVIDTVVVRVRPFEAFTPDSKKKRPDEVVRSTFLGGLSPGTTVEMIQEELAKVGMVVVNVPVLKSGYCPQVVLETFEQAQKLLEMKRLQINGALVNVRPFANIRSSGKKKRRN